MSLVRYLPGKFYCPAANASNTKETCHEKNAIDSDYVRSAARSLG